MEIHWSWTELTGFDLPDLGPTTAGIDTAQSMNQRPFIQQWQVEAQNGHNLHGIATVHNEPGKWMDGVLGVE